MTNENEAVFPQAIETAPDDVFLYRGLARQNLEFHQCLSELIDNAISAKEGEYFAIEILLHKEGEDIHLLVADNGKGMTLGDLTQRVLRLGGKGSETGILNEHGFGLKNSLCTLTGNEEPFRIITRNETAVRFNHYYEVHGPFSRNMKVELGVESDWLKDLTRCRGDTGTRVHAQTSFTYFRTLYPSGQRLDTLVERLMEHLGVIYRGFLKDPRNEIWIRWREEAADWIDDRVRPIEVPYISSNSEKIEVRVNGDRQGVTYTWGRLDDSAIQDGSPGKPFPLKIYYQSNQRTQGIDVRVRGRVILPHVMTEIWPEVQRHGDHNKFVGELAIDSKEFVTVNNKTNLDGHNAYWERLREILQDPRYQPESFKHARTEENIKSQLKERLEAIVGGSEARNDFPTWGGAGVKVDILHRKGDREDVYEIKAGQVTPRDVYQLVMYWDGRVKDGHTPEVGRLVGRNAPTSVEEMIGYWNGRKDANGHSYILEFKSIDTLLGR